jgi:molybdate transport system substrate-binding protein
MTIIRLIVLRRPSLIPLLACLVLLSDRAPAQDLSIAAASDLQAVFPTLAERFQRESGHRVGLTFGSSGNFFSQIQNGAPFDLFFSADIEYASRLEAAGFAERGSLYRYATGRIVLWTRNDSGIDVRRGLSVLGDSRVRRVAIANPEHAPYGRAAVAALRHEKLYDGIRSKFVFGESVSQAAQFIQSGNAEAGIIALSTARTPALRSGGSYYEIPTASYPAIEQAAVIASASRRKDVARQFLAFFRRPEISLLMQLGFSIHPANP